MNVVIVPSHNQGKHIEKIVRSYESQTVLPDLLLFVFDRCSDDSLDTISKIVTKLNLKWISKTVGENFSAGMTRDFGIDFVQGNFPEYFTIIFTDGDSTVSERLVEKHLENCSSKYPVVSCGKRFKETLSGTWIEDERLDSSWVNQYSFTQKNGRLLVSNALTLDNIFTYSCNFAFNKLAIESCQNINEHLSDSRRVFNKCFDGSWGSEDNFISHCIFRIGGCILLTDHECFVNHFYHEEQPRNQKLKRLILQDLSKKLERLILDGTIEGPVQIVKKHFCISFGNGDYINDIKNLVDVEKIDCRILNVIDHVCNKYKMEDQKNIFKWFLTTNYKEAFSQEFPKHTDGYEISKFKEMLGYMKFYLKNDEIIFEDDLEHFLKIDKKASLFDYA